MEYKHLDGIGYLAAQDSFRSDLPTLIFIHGAVSSALFWEFQLKGLAGRANAVAIDLPGHGRDVEKAVDEIDAYARIVAVFLEKLSPPRPVPCGLSMGGAIVQRLLIDYADVFFAGIIINSGARLKTSPVIFELIENDYEGFRDLIYQLAIYDKNYSPMLAEAVASSSSRSPETAMRDFRACDNFNAMNELGKIDASVLILSGAEDKLTPLKYSEFLAKNIRCSELAVIWEAGHFSPLEKSNKVNEAMLDFLERV